MDLTAFRRDLVVSMGVDMYAMAVGAVAAILLARSLGAEPYGLLVGSLALAALLASLTDFGLQKLILRDVIDDGEPSQKRLGELATVKAALVLAGFVVGLTMVRAALPEQVAQARPILPWLILSALIGGIADFIRTSIWSRDRVGLDSLLRALERTTYLLLVVIFSFLGGTLLAFSQLLLVLTVLYLGATFLATARVFQWPMLQAVDLRSAKRLLSEMLPIGLTGVLISFYFRIDVLVLAWWRSAEEVGWYSVAYSLIVMIAGLAVLFARLLMPHMARYQHDAGRFERLLVTGSSILLVGGFVSAFCLTGFGGRIVVPLFGVTFAPSERAITILAAVLPALFWAPLLSNGLIILRGQNYLLQIAAINALLTFLIDVLLIPQWGVTGAIAATVIAEFTGVFLHLNYLSRLATVPVLSRSILLTMACGMILWFGVFLARAYWFIAVPGAIVLFAFCVRRVGLLPAEDFRLVAQAIPAWRSRSE